MQSRISVNVEAQEEIIAVLQKCSCDIGENASELVQAFKNLAADSHYEHLVKQSNTIIAFYNEVIVSKILEICEDWSNSNQSIASYCEIARAGENACETARQLMKDMILTIEDNLPKIMEIDDVDTSEFSMSEELYEDLKKEAATRLDNIKDAYMNSKKEAEDIEQNNAMAGGLYAPIEAIGISIINPFEEIVDRVIDSIREEFVEINASIRNMSSAAAEEVASESSNVNADELMGELLSDIM
ncbi:MAG: hypothetical protein II997_04985 [Clostridia bacterium]|nr:hypothetical protein [Clostridia bacterium]